jgi:hypothetical protein
MDIYLPMPYNRAIGKLFLFIRGEVMLKIEDILSGNYSSYPEEIQKFMRKYDEKLRENIKNELINHMAEKMLKDIDKSKDYFINTLSEILENGFKGLDKMSTRTLLNMYLEKKGQENFIKLLEKVGSELEASTGYMQ